ncbi:MarR family winged helix-turn-helix transcriptional regulator [Citricoccus zhacaiensis]
MPLDVELYVRYLRPSPAAGGVTDYRIPAPPDTTHRSPDPSTTAGPEAPKRPNQFAGDSSAESRSILALFRASLRAEQRMLARTRTRLRIGDTDLMALRTVVEAQATGTVLRQRELADHLGITTAAVSILIDRLTRAGYVHRIPHPADRRSVAIKLNEATESAVRHTLENMTANKLRSIDSLTEDQQEAVTTFLARLTTAMDGFLGD